MLPTTLAANYNILHFHQQPPKEWTFEEVTTNWNNKDVRMVNEGTHPTASLSTVTNLAVTSRDDMTQVCHEVMGEKLDSLRESVARAASHMATFSAYIETPHHLSNND